MSVDNTEVLETNEMIVQPNLDHEKWFDENIGSYRTLAAMVSATLKSALDGEEISYVDIPFREKNKKSFLKKIKDKNESKNYSHTDMTDLAGIRVITLIESDVQKVGKIIEELFNVHPEESINKSETLGENKVGYRSVHYVCDIGTHRENLPEWKKLKNLCFEIQVRTALEHAWAEIEHDRGYKLGGTLPSHLSRRFSLLSGLLESADLEFNRLTVEIKEYAKTLENDIENDQNLNIELSTIGVKKLIQHVFSDIEYIYSEDKYISSSIDDVINFGITNLNELKKVLMQAKPNLPKNSFRTELGLIFYSLLAYDIDKYLEKCLPKTTLPMGYMPSELIEPLSKIYPDKNISDLLEKNNIKILHLASKSTS
ncbi:hypothetical protein NRA42_04085 [Acinetobacter baumannii]|nr:hypothetical protein [Acinetobacter baumannii]HCA5723039.1 hypothetical protein [Acinetobacter baumannii]